MEEKGFASDVMPYGKYKGKNMKDLPPDYLLFLYDNKKCTDKVYAYISSNLDSIISDYAKEVNLPLDVVNFLRLLKLNVNQIIYTKAEILFKTYLKQ